MPSAPRLYEIDVVRILTFACVIGVHTTSHTAAADDVGLYGLLALLHFTREVFFALTAFVLAYSYFSKPQPFVRTIPRRLLLVAVPYVTWSLIYFVSSNLRSPHYTFGEATVSFLQHLVEGTAWYHLYFLLVTMQVYVLFPVFLWIIEKTRGRHVLLLAVTGAYQLVFTWLLRYSPGSLGWVSHNPKSLFITYLFFIVLGAVCAFHAREFLLWVRAHRRLIAVLTAASGVALLGFFAVSIDSGISYYKAGTPLQPVLMVWSVFVGLGFLALGTWWSDRRDPESRIAKAVTVISDRSFGIFLAHPIVLWILLWVGDGWVEAHVPTPWLTLVAYVIVVLLAYGISTLARRTRASLALAGRPFKRANRRLPEPVAAG
jgi:peptidoglycan/LPS O-acetylase OafA/YrhL